ncbi:MAG: TPM domain-containing protein [Ardenticatenaceae bacterium]|nr:TPM domain-containing protein [Ardenticatenaceae bacterium]
MNKHQTFLILFIVFVLSFFSFLAVHAQESTPQFPEPPAEEEFVLDLAEIITPEDEELINVQAADLWEREAVPLYVVTIDSLEGQNAADLSIEQYATMLFASWGIGSPERNLNRGILVLVARRDRIARIELGYDWDRVYDDVALSIMDNNIIPQFRREAYSSGLVDGVGQLVIMAESDLATAASAPAPRPTSIPVQLPSRSVSPSSQSSRDYGSLFMYVILYLGLLGFGWLLRQMGFEGSYDDDDEYDYGSSWSSRSSSRRSFRSRSSSGSTRSRSSSPRSGGSSRGGGASGRW